MTRKCVKRYGKGCRCPDCRIPDDLVFYDHPITKEEHDVRLAFANIDWERAEREESIIRLKRKCNGAR